MAGGPLDALVGLRVLDLSDAIAGSYCTKLLADAGALVVKVEPPGGHRLRSWSVSGSVGSDGDPDGALFRYIAAGQHSVLADIGEPSGRDQVLELATNSDILVESFAPGFLGGCGLGGEELHAANPSLTIVSITPFGQEGPRSREATNDFLLQALSGSLYNHGLQDRVPLAVGGGLGEWIAGAYAAAGALAARAGTERTGLGQHVDVSALECLAVTFVSYPSVAASVPGGVPRRATYDMVPGVEPCKDGFVGLTTLTVQQWQDFLAMIDRRDLAEDLTLNHPRGRAKRRDELRAHIHAWTRERTAAEIVEQAALFRVPAAPVLDGAGVANLDHLVARELFDTNPRGDFPHPRPPFRSSATSPRPVAPAPRSGEHDPDALGSRRSPRTTQAEPLDPHRPLEGVRVLDFTAFWAGPSATQYLATLGADVIKVESIQRPDAIRFSAMVPPTTDQWYEQGFLFLSANLDKRGITLHLGDPLGRKLALALVARSDVVVENFSPRVMEQFGLTYEKLRLSRKDIISVRMPGWGLDGPWRDRPGFATTMEQAAGMAWVTGYEDGPPLAPGLCDPLAGVHAAFAILAALEQRRRTGRGQEIELSMVDLAVSVAAEPIIEHAVYGHLMTREGNHGTAAPQGVYPCAGREEWIALSVSTDADWAGLRSALGSPPWTDDPALAADEGRRSARSRLDAEIGAWCATHSRAHALAKLRGANVPAEPVVRAHEIDQDIQMQARGFWESVDHPIVGTIRYPGWPMRISGGLARWHRSSAPLLGQDTDEVLGEELGLSPDDLAEFRDAGVIGRRPLGL